MPDCLLKFSPVAVGGAGHEHIYYGQFYVGVINPAATRWRVWLNGITLGEFGSLGEAKRAVVEWYYGPEAAAGAQFRCEQALREQSARR